MFRFKQAFTPQLSARTLPRQAREVGMKCRILNQFHSFLNLTA
jgi:hypothetical protein